MSRSSCCVFVLGGVGALFTPARIAPPRARVALRAVDADTLCYGALAAVVAARAIEGSGRNVTSVSTDLSPRDTLLRQGPIPFFIRVSRPTRYEADVRKYMARYGCERATAQRNVDAYNGDPNGWVVQKQRAAALGGDEEIDYDAFASGVVRRPVFSVAWTALLLATANLIVARVDELSARGCTRGH